MSVALAATHHDPDGRLYDQTTRALPLLAEIFDGLAIELSPITQERSLGLLRAGGALTRREASERYTDYRQLGRSRRAALELALRLEASFVVFCDFDRALHWAERYPEELARVVAQIPQNDFTILGRSERAFASHPRTQHDTEAIVNYVYSTVSGKAWDVTAAARGISRRAGAAILSDCRDESIGTDVSWPLFLQRDGRFTLGYIATEGLEFETADRYGDEIAAAGSSTQWIARLDADPRRWADRLNLARVEVEALLPYLDTVTG